ncbi:uncharacterized protein LOC130756702 isoform X2 [Actinidia eriantha]|uniref:uncharacterized protein LOC130756702 isoform X2 n=1 Tax=Actinidia eriantha TaxID=165200 RepID=UPI00258D79D7|nr:uncharacterized protein LOC130756702 isoform X2 [Actinidia eriantha]
MASASNREVMDVTSWKSDSPSQTSSKEATAELEAAKALAGLAHFAAPESGNRCWIEGEGSSQRVKTESPADYSGMIPEASVEDEKEARKIRRVLANRESARQTIRRRQEKKLAVKDYDTLKNTNECLKAEMAKTIKTEVQETKLDSESTNTQIPTSAYANCLFLIYNQSPPAPSSWPSIIQSPNPVPLQNGFQNAIVVPSEVPMSSIASPGSFHDQENSLKIGTPLYILPCPWFFPLPDHRSGLLSRPSFNLNDQQAGISMNNQNCACLSPKITECEENHQPSLPIKGKIEDSCSIGVRPNNVDEMPFSFPPDGGGQNLEHHHEGVILLPAPLESTWSTSIVKHDIGLQPPDYTPTVQLYPSVSHTGKTLQGMKRDLYIGSSKEKKKAKAAAEARKKRKELVKLKRLHYC